VERFVARPVCAADATGIDIAGPVTLDADLIVPTAAHGMVLIARQRQQSLQPPQAPWGERAPGSQTRHATADLPRLLTLCRPARTIPGRAVTHSREHVTAATSR